MDSDWPSIYADPDGTAHVVWNDEFDYGDSDNDVDVFYVRIGIWQFWKTAVITVTIFILFFTLDYYYQHKREGLP